MVSALASRAVDPELESRSGKTQDYNIVICCWYANHTALRRKNKDWLGQNLDILFRIGVICLAMGCISELLLYKSNQSYRSSTNQISLSLSLCSPHDTADKLFYWRYTTITHKFLWNVHSWLLFRFSLIYAYLLQ